MPIPFQGEPIQNFTQGMEAGGNLLQRLLQGKQLQQQAMQHQQNLAFQKQQEQRLIQAEARRQALFPGELQKLEIQTNPEVKAQYYQNLISKLQELGMGGANNDALTNAVIAKEFPGYDPNAETPEQEGTRELANKIKLEEEKARLKAENPSPGTEIKPTGTSATQAYVDNLRSKYGDDDPKVKAAQHILDLEVADLESQIGKRNITPGEAAEQKLDAKELVSMEQDIPKVEMYLGFVEQAIDILESEPAKYKAWFGTPVGMTKERADEFRNQIDDPVKGRLESIFGELIGPQEMEFSSQGAVAALKVAENLKANFGNPYGVTLGKLKHIQEKFNHVLMSNSEKIARIKNKLYKNKKEPKSEEGPKNEETSDFSAYTDDELRMLLKDEEYP